jgi:hypothetical protein
MTRVATVTDAEAHLHEQVEHVPFGSQSAALILGACQVCGDLPGVSCLPGVSYVPGVRLSARCAEFTAGAAGPAPVQRIRLH